MRTPYVAGEGLSNAEVWEHARARKAESRSTAIKCLCNAGFSLVKCAVGLVLRFLFAAHAAQVDAKLLGFFIQMAAFQTECFCGESHIELAALQFG
jgi:hypothetical protein